MAPGETPADRAVQTEVPAPAEPLPGESEAGCDESSLASDSGEAPAAEANPVEPDVPGPMAESFGRVTESAPIPSDASDSLEPLPGESDRASHGSSPTSDGGEKPAGEADPAEPVNAAEMASECTAMGGDSGSGTPTVAPTPGRCRASDNPILAIPLEQYLTLVQQLADDALSRRSGVITEGGLNGLDAEALGILESHGLNAAACATHLNQLETRCRRAFGAARPMSERARAAAQNWFHGIGFCREVFVDLEDHT